MILPARIKKGMASSTNESKDLKSLTITMLKEISEPIKYTRVEAINAKGMGILIAMKMKKHINIRIK